MSQFKVGGKVVAIDNLYITNNSGDVIVIKKGDILTVLNIRKCACGTIMLDVGFTSKLNKNPCTECWICGRREPTSIWYLATKYFIPLEDTEFKQVEYTQIIEQIPACAQ